MTRSAKVWTSAFLTAIGSIGLLWIFRWLFLAPCSSGYPYILFVLFFPFAAFLAAFPGNAPLFFFILAFGQYPLYGFFLGRAWVRREPFSALLVLATHIFAVIAAGIALKDEI